MSTDDAAAAAIATAAVEAAFAALPAPSAAQRSTGWSRDWSQLWALHERKLIDTYTPTANDATANDSGESSRP